MWTYNYSTELYHHGVKGQKWGVRRDLYSKATFRQKRALKKYAKETDKFIGEYGKVGDNIYVKAHNKTADHWENSGKLARFEKKHNLNTDEGMEKLDKAFSKDLNRNMSKMKLDYISHNEHYQKAESIRKKYNLSSVSKLAKEHDKVIAQLKKELE